MKFWYSNIFDSLSIKRYCSLEWFPKMLCSRLNKFYNLRCWVSQNLFFCAQFWVKKLNAKFHSKLKLKRRLLRPNESVPPPASADPKFCRKDKISSLEQGRYPKYQKIWERKHKYWNLSSKPLTHPRTLTHLEEIAHPWLEILRKSSSNIYWIQIWIAFQRFGLTSTVQWQCSLWKTRLVN